MQYDNMCHGYFIYGFPAGVERAVILWNTFAKENCQNSIPRKKNELSDTT